MDETTDVLVPALEFYVAPERLANSVTCGCGKKPIFENVQILIANHVAISGVKLHINVFIFHFTNVYINIFVNVYNSQHLFATFNHSVVFTKDMTLFQYLLKDRTDCIKWRKVLPASRTSMGWEAWKKLETRVEDAKYLGRGDHRSKLMLKGSRTNVRKHLFLSSSIRAWNGLLGIAVDPLPYKVDIFEKFLATDKTAQIQ